MGKKCYPLTIRDAKSRFILGVTHLSDSKVRSVKTNATPKIAQKSPKVPKLPWPGWGKDGNESFLRRQ